MRRARQEWTAAEALVNAKRWNEANTALSSFKNNQSKTKTYALAEEQFNKYMKEVEFALRPYLEGAAVSYFKGRDFNVTDKVLSRIERTVDFKLDGPKTIAKEVPHDNWCARWEGAIRVPTNGHYTFVVVVDDGIRLWIDGKGVLDDWRDSAAHRVTGQIDLTEGFHEFKLEYYQATGPSTCRFSWSLKNGFSEHIVPAEALCHREPPKDPPKK